MIKLKNSLKSIILAFSLCMSPIMFMGCSDDDNCISGEGNVITKTLNINDFTGINLEISADVIIRQGDVQEIKVISNSNIINQIKTDVSNDIWDINMGNGCYNYDNLNIEITISDIKNISIDGTGEITIEEFKNQNTLTTKINGTGDIVFNKETRLKKLNSTINGAGNILGFNLICDDAEIDINGVGDVEITVNEKLDVTIGGIGNVSYKGSPTITQEINIISSIINAN